MRTYRRLLVRSSSMVALAEAGKLKCIIDEHFPFDKAPDALSKSLTARSGGKLVIDVA